MRLRNADQWLTFGFNFPGCWEKIPDKLFVTDPTGTVESQNNDSMIKSWLFRSYISQYSWFHSCNRSKFSKVYRELVFQPPAELDLGGWVPINFWYRNAGCCVPINFCQNLIPRNERRLLKLIRKELRVFKITQPRMLIYGAIAPLFKPHNHCTRESWKRLTKIEDPKHKKN